MVHSAFMLHQDHEGKGQAWTKLWTRLELRGSQTRQSGRALSNVRHRSLSLAANQGHSGPHPFLHLLPSSPWET
jgi:hypothetical protein